MIASIETVPILPSTCCVLTHPLLGGSLYCCSWINPSSSAVQTGLGHVWKAWLSASFLPADKAGISFKGSRPSGINTTSPWLLSTGVLREALLGSYLLSSFPFLFPSLLSSSFLFFVRDRVRRSPGWPVELSLILNSSCHFYLPNAGIMYVYHHHIQTRGIF